MLGVTNKNKPNTTFSRNIFSIPNQSMPYPSNYPKSDITSFSGNLSKNLFINKRILLPIILSMPILGAVKPNKKVSIFTKILNFFGIKTIKQKEEERRNEKKLNTISNIILDNLKEGTFGIKEVKEIKETLQNEEIPPEEKKDKTTNFLQKYNCVKDVKKAIEDASDNETDDNDFLDSIEKSIDRMEQKIESDEYIKKTLKTQQKIIDVKNIILENSKPDKINRKEIKDIKTTLNNNTITPEKKRIEIQDFLRKNKIEKEVKEVIGDENDELENLFTQAINKLPIKDIPKKPKSSSSSSSSRSGDSYHYTTYNTYNTPASPPPADPVVHHYHHYSNPSRRSTGRIRYHLTGRKPSARKNPSPLRNTIFNPHPSFISRGKPVYSDYSDYSASQWGVVSSSDSESFHSCCPPSPEPFTSLPTQSHESFLYQSVDVSPEPLYESTFSLPKEITIEESVGNSLEQEIENQILTPQRISQIIATDLPTLIATQAILLLKLMLVKIASGKEATSQNVNILKLIEDLAAVEKSKTSTQYANSILRCAQYLTDYATDYQLGSQSIEENLIAIAEQASIDGRFQTTLWGTTDYQSKSEKELVAQVASSLANKPGLSRKKHEAVSSDIQSTRWFWQSPVTDSPVLQLSTIVEESTQRKIPLESISNSEDEEDIDIDNFTTNYTSSEIPGNDEESSSNNSELEPEPSDTPVESSPRPSNTSILPTPPKIDTKHEVAVELSQTQNNTPPEIKPISCDKMAQELGEQVNQGNIILQQMLIDVASGQNPSNTIAEIEKLKENLAENDPQLSYLDSIIRCAQLLFNEDGSVKQQYYLRWKNYRLTKAAQLEKLGTELSYNGSLAVNTDRAPLYYMCVLSKKLGTSEYDMDRAGRAYWWSGREGCDPNFGVLIKLVSGYKPSD